MGDDWVDDTGLQAIGAGILVCGLCDGGHGELLAASFSLVVIAFADSIFVVCADGRDRWDDVDVLDIDLFLFELGRGAGRLERSVGRMEAPSKELLVVGRVFGDGIGFWGVSSVGLGAG